MQTPEERAAYVISQTIGAGIEALGMVAKNQDRLSLGQSIAYDDAAFLEVIENWGIHHNGVLGILNGGH